MKKIVSTIACTMALAGAALAQGTVNWVAPAGNVIVQTNSTVYSTFGGSGAATGTGTVGNTLGSTAANNTALGYGGYYFELLVSSSASAAPTNTSQLSAWLDTGLGGTNAASNNGRLNVLNSSSQAVANNWASGVTEGVILVGWSANLGTSWSGAESNLVAAAAIQGAYFGTSVYASLAAQSGNPGVTVFGTGVGQVDNPSTSPLQLDLVQVVPEPATMALAAIGGASLLLFRRKNKN